MAYRIKGLDPELYAPLFRMTDAELAARHARRVTATAKPGFPCRATLEDAEPGETVLLFNHVSNDVTGPFRASFAVYVREGAAPAAFRDGLPPVFATRMLTLRAFDAEGELKAAELVAGKDADAAIRRVFANPAIDRIDAHYAAPGCFAAKIVRD